VDSREAAEGVCRGDHSGPGQIGVALLGVADLEWRLDEHGPFSL
jgi:hypothetical protein